MTLGALLLNPGYTVFDLGFPKKQTLRQEVNLEGDFRKGTNEAKRKAELIKSTSGKGLPQVQWEVPTDCSAWEAEPMLSFSADSGLGH